MPGGTCEVMKPTWPRDWGKAETRFTTCNGQHYLAGDIVDELGKRSGPSGDTNVQFTQRLVAGNTRKTESSGPRLMLYLGA